MTAGHAQFAPKPVVICGVIRRSFYDAAFVYKNGSCFEFHLILRSIFPQAKPWTNIDHVWSEIDGEFWDIDGRRKEGAKGLFSMADEPRILRNAFRWKRRSSWRVDQAKIEELEAAK